MARRRKTDTKVPMKPQAKSSIRKSTRQKAKKQQLEDEKVNGGITSESADNSENLKDSNDMNGKEPPSQLDVLNKLELHERCGNEDVSSKNIENNADKPNYENYSTQIVSIEEFEFLHDKSTVVNENSSNEAVCSEDVIEETTIYEEMEIETESTVDCPVISHKNTIEPILFVNDSKLEEKNTLKCSEMESEIISGGSVIVSPDHIDKLSLTNMDSGCTNSNSYQMIEKGLSGLHMSESEIYQYSKELYNVDSESNTSQNESTKTIRNARAKKFAGTLMNSTKKDKDYRKKKSDGPVEQNYSNTDDENFNTESNKKIIDSKSEDSLLTTEINKRNVKVVNENFSKQNKHGLSLTDKIESKSECSAQDNRTLITSDILSEKEIEDDKLILTVVGEKLMHNEQLFEKPKPNITEEHSINSEINSKMDFEDIKLSSSSESSSDTLLSKTYIISHLTTINESNEQCDLSEIRTGTKHKNEDNDATKSENGSNNSGVRRSNRIKHIGLRKQRSRGRGLVVKPFQESQKAYACSERDKLMSSAATEPEQHVNPTTQFDKESIKCMIVPQDNLTPALSNTSVTNCDSDSNKPVKVKSRWRRSSELEMSNSTSWTAPQSNVTVSFAGTEPSVENRFSFSNNTINKESNYNVESLQAPRVLLEEESNTTIPLENITVKTSTSALSNDSSPNVLSAVIPNIVGAKICLPMVPEIDREMEERLSQFEHLKENLYLTERYTNKETKRMVCDCFLTEEEIQRGELGCGEDCLNRLLMIECGSRCVVGDRCTNKRFQNYNYANCEVFRTDKKGFGLRAITNLDAGEFIMEYVGEVVNSRDFRRRAKEYSKDKNRHYYFMALKSEQIIDATMKGNISRFINHSCDPNAETQKWTVNGELRIGFFIKKFVASGEEITFDYHFQRYGKEAQKCFCEAANCRGWIGDNPEDGKSNVECMEDDEMDTEDESDDEEDQEDEEEKPEKQVRRTKREEKKIADHMEDEDLEEQIDRLCASGLKNRAHTLTLSRLMVRCRELQHRRRLLEVVQLGEQPCRRLFLDYHGLRLMWSYMMDVAGSDTEEAQQFRLEILKTLTTLPIPNRTMLIDSKVLSVVEKWSKQLYHSPSGDSPDDEQSKLKLTSEDAEMKEADKDKAEPKKEDEIKAAAAAAAEQSLIGEVAGNLLESWSNLKEVFRIPKKERLEQMKEHEREADRGYKEDAEKEARDTLSYERHRSERYRGGGPGQGEPDKRLRRGRESPAEFKDKRPAEERSNLVQVPRMSKFERRQLFALKVAKEEEERQRRQQLELWQQHQAQCLALGVDPCATAALDPQSGYPLFFDPQLAQWQAYPGQEGALYLQPQPQPQQQQQPAASFAAAAALAALAAPGEQPPPDSEQPPPALDLPPKWKWARDKRGRVYYYHARERVAQWLPPPPDHIGLQPDSGPDTSSDETSDESGSSRDNDDDEELEPEDAEAGACAEADEPLAAADPEAQPEDEPLALDELQPPAGLDGAVDLEPPPPKQPDHRKRRDGLVQERIISPRREEDRVDHTKFKELKERLRRQKEKSRLKEHLHSDKARKHRRSAKSKSHVNKTQAKSFQTITSDMSPTTERKIKDNFRIDMAHVMVHFLNPYRKSDCKQGRITNTEDFKYLARKLTHFVLAKELKHCKSVDELECNDNVKHKAKDFVRKYMNKFGAVYQRDKDED